MPPLTCPLVPRPKSGRPVKVKIAFSLSPDLVNQLKTLAYERRVPLSQLVESILKSTVAAAAPLAPPAPKPVEAPPAPKPEAPVAPKVEAPKPAPKPAPVPAPAQAPKPAPKPEAPAPKDPLAARLEADGFAFLSEIVREVGPEGAKRLVFEHSGEPLRAMVFPGKDVLIVREDLYRSLRDELRRPGVPLSEIAERLKGRREARLLLAIAKYYTLAHDRELGWMLPLANPVKDIMSLVFREVDRIVEAE